MVSQSAIDKKACNKAAVLRRMRRLTKPITRDTLAYKMGLQPATLAQYINELISERQVVLDHRGVNGVKHYRAESLPVEKHTHNEMITKAWR